VTGAPLQHLSVLEVGGGVAVRYCGRLFARLGAAVTRIPGGTPDEALSYGGTAGAAYGAWLDEGKAIASDPDAGAYDLVIVGQTRAEAAAGAAMAASLAGAPTVLSLTWFDQAGPYADWQANDPIIHALTGAAFSFGLPEGPPVLAQGHSPQVVAGLTGYIAALAGLLHAETRPERIDVNAFEAAMCFTEPGAVTGPYGAESLRLGVNRYSPTYPNGIYSTADGVVGLTALTPPQWAALCASIGQPELASDPRFITSLERLAQADVIDEILKPALTGRTTAEWVAEGDRRRIPITPVPRPGEMDGVPHWRDRGSFAPIGDIAGAPKGPTLPFRMSWDDVAAPRPSGGPLGPLQGLRAADFSMGWAGPLAGRYLADLGADVLKVESRVKPDWWRGWEVIEDADPPLTEMMPNFMCANRGKRGLDVDLSTALGLERAKALIALSDVVLENLGPGVMDGLGLGPADQRTLRPGVISVSMPPFGKNGPLSGIRAYGSTVEQASGMPYANGHEDWPPCMQHVAYGDPVAGLYATAAILTALHGRERLGGADIELCQVECLFQLGADAAIAEHATGAPAPRTGSRRASASLSCVVAGVGEEAWLAVVADTEAAWSGLCATLERAEWTAIPLAERQRRAVEVEAAVAAWAKGREVEDAASALQAAGVPAAPAHPATSRWYDQQLAESDYWVSQTRLYIDTHLTPAPPFRFDGARPEARMPAPVLGEHTAEVFAELGLATPVEA
jgi:crotonobetainyl-CoA:carnitine CoA-transferase CaiB-like acyl-CoA transferase